MKKKLLIPFYLVVTFAIIFSILPKNNVEGAPSDYFNLVDFNQNGTNVLKWHRTNKTEIMQIPDTYYEREYETRAAWVATVYNLDFPKSNSIQAFKNEYQKLLNNFESHNLNTVFFQVRASLEAFYPSEHNPISPLLGLTEAQLGNFDPLQYMVEETHKRGMEYHAWMNPYRVATGVTKVAGEDPNVTIARRIQTLDNKSYIKKNPDHYLYKLNDAGTAYDVILNPALPEVIEHITETLMEVARNYDVDGINFDDYFYLGNLAKSEDLNYYNEYKNSTQVPLSHDDWRRDNVNKMVKECHDKLEEFNATSGRRKEIRFGISPAGVWRSIGNDPATGANCNYAYECYDALWADVRKWVLEGWLDYVSPQIYWHAQNGSTPFCDLVDWWRDLVVTAKARGHNVQLNISAGAYRFDDSTPWTAPVTEMIDQIRYISKYEEVTGYTLYRYSTFINPQKADTKTAMNLLKAAWTKKTIPSKPKSNNMNAASLPQAAQIFSEGEKSRVTFEENTENAYYYSLYRFPSGTINKDFKDPRNFLGSVSGQGLNRLASISSNLSYSSSYDYYLKVTDFQGNVSENELKCTFVSSSPLVAKATEYLSDLPLTITNDAKTDILNTSTAFNLLSAAEKSSISSANQTKIADYVAAYEVIRDINQAGTIGSQLFVRRVDFANENYNKLSQPQKDLIAGSEKNRLADYYKIIPVYNKILEVKEFSYSEEMYIKITQARSDYNTLTDSQKLLVAQAYNLLTNAEDLYAKIETLIEKIDAIGTVIFNDETNARIQTAKEAFAALTVAEKDFVPDSKEMLLSDADILYNSVKDTVDLIDNIGTVVVSSAVNTRINNARNAYDNLTQAQKNIIPLSKVKILTDAENIYQKANNVIGLIDAIGVVQYTEASLGKITLARNAFDLLTDEQKDAISSTKKNSLINAENKYQDLENKAFASVVIALINEIGTVSYNNECKEKIDLALSAYEKLNEVVKALVTNYSVLTEAINTYEELKELVYKDEFKQMLDVITIELTEDCNQKINLARKFYNGLSEIQKQEVEEDYLRLSQFEKAYQDLLDLKAVEIVVALISKIGKVSYTLESFNKIAAARDAYKELTEAQTILLKSEDLKILTDAEKEYEYLHNLSVIENVVKLINDIGKVTNSAACLEKISLARDAYEKLDSAQKALFSENNLKVLIDAENDFGELSDNHKKASAVIALINNIGTVTLETNELISATRSAYNNLTETQKILVGAGVYKILTDAESRYADLVAVNGVLVLIQAIGIVGANSKAKIESARNAYDSLSGSRKNLISAADFKILTDAEKTFIDITTALPVKDLILLALVNPNFSDESKGAIAAARSAYNKLSSAEKAIIGEIIEDLEEIEAIYEKLDNVVALIEAIGKVTFTQNSFLRINAAKDAYNALSESEKELITGKNKVITDAEAKYLSLKTIAEVINLFYNIGTVTLTNNKIKEARNAYNNLSLEQKALVNDGDLSILINAEKEYENLIFIKQLEDLLNQFIIGKLK